MDKAMLFSLLERSTASGSRLRLVKTADLELGELQALVGSLCSTRVQIWYERPGTGIPHRGTMVDRGEGLRGRS